MGKRSKKCIDIGNITGSYLPYPTTFSIEFENEDSEKLGYSHDKIVVELTREERFSFEHADVDKADILYYIPYDHIAISGLPKYVTKFKVTLKAGQAFILTVSDEEACMEVERILF